MIITAHQTMPKQLKHKRSIGERLKDHCTTAMHSLKQMSNAVLMHGVEDKDVDELFDSDNDDNESSRDFVTALKKESRNMTNCKIRTNPMIETVTTTTAVTLTHNLKSTSATVDGNDETSDIIDTNTNINTNTNTNTNSLNKILHPDGSELWEQQRIEWLTPTIPVSDITKRKSMNTLHRLSTNNDDVYLGVYKNLVVYGKPLKKGLNMTDGFKVIYAGWESTKMFERVANGGVP